MPARPGVYLVRSRLAMNLRPYQQQCLERILARYKEGRRRLLVSLPTGTGKTVVFAKLPAFLKMKNRMLVLAHREELLEQAAAKFVAVAPELSIGIEQGSRTAPPDARIVLASVPTVGRRLSLECGGTTSFPDELREDRLDVSLPTPERMATFPNDDPCVQTVGELLKEPSPFSVHACAR